MYLPNGLSLNQFKKNAKKLSKTESFSLSKAQNKLTRQEFPFFSDYYQLYNHIKKLGFSNHCLKFKDLNSNQLRLPVFKKKPVVTLDIQPGFGGDLFRTQLNTLNDDKSLFCKYS